MKKGEKDGLKMAKKSERDTKGRIINAAWQLFYKQGYEATTIDEIVEASQTSKGSFYHYFDSKDMLLGTLSYMFDKKYEELMETLDPEMNSFDKLIYLNRELFFMIETGIPMELLSRLLSTQLVTPVEKHLLDRRRTYYRLLREITLEGQNRGQLRADIPVGDIVKAYALCERALMYDWCLCNGEYSLSRYSGQMLPMFLRDFKCEK